MREEAFDLLLQSKGLGKAGEGKGKKVKAVDELDAPGNGYTEELGTVDDLRGRDGLSVKFLEGEVPVVPLKIMRDHNVGAACMRVRVFEMQQLPQQLGDGRKL